MGAQFHSSEIPQLVNSYVHLSSPKFWSSAACISGLITYVEVSKSPKIFYLQPYGLEYSIRVDVSEYAISEKIEEDEQH
jgi:hypothetical protein